MKIDRLFLKDYRGFKDAEFNFGDFACLVGPNGIGKTSILDAVSLLCSSLDFKDDKVGPGGKWVPTATGDQRLKAFLRKNVRGIDDENPCKGFEVHGIFEHEGKKLEAVLTQNGFVTNDVIKEQFWWAGICFFAQFDMDMTNFQLRKPLWEKFAKSWEAITGYPAVAPDIYVVDKLAKVESDAEYCIGFSIKKPAGKVHCRKGSAGEKKIIKALTTIVNLEEERQPHIILCDNICMHVYDARHLAMIEVLKDLFKGKQIVSTAHSSVLVEKYEPKEHIIDVEKAVLRKGLE